MARHEKVHSSPSNCSLGSFSPDRPPLTSNSEYRAYRVEFVGIAEVNGKIDLEVKFCDVTGTPQEVIKDVQNPDVAWWHYPSTIIIDNYEFGWLLLSPTTADNLGILNLAAGKWPAAGGSF